MATYDDNRNDASLSGGRSEGSAAFAAAGIPTENVWNQATVVVADDHAPNVTLLEMLLRSAGVTRVHGLTDPREVVARCLEIRPDLLLLDLQMPHMDGFAVMKALKAAPGADTLLPVIVITADSTSETKKRALAAGAKDFLTKPFDRTEVLLRVQNLLEMRAVYTALQGYNVRLQAKIDEETKHRRQLEAEHRRRRREIEQALTSEARRAVFQPIASLATGRVVGVEALTRFECEPRRPPNEWFAEAADVGLGVELELAAAATALGSLNRLPGALYLSVNLSPAAVTAASLSDLLRGLPGDRLVVELTEHFRVDVYDPLVAALDALRSCGIRIAVDDAGAGYAGLQHILRLRPDLIKLDTGLTRGIDDDPVRRALATSLLTFAQEMDAAIVAEGIETAQELTTLRSLGVPWGQGYHLARPGPLPLPSLDVSTEPPSTAGNGPPTPT